MKITITMDLTAENLDKLKALFDSPSETVVEQTPAPAPESEQKAVQASVKAVAMKLSKAGKQKELAAAFAKFGCKKLSDFNDRPDDYPVLMKELMSIDV